ncbi:hypothetical protein L9F63_023672 [Diploptera punctata]|uniref:Uncharacterized protein n=1 Tax=Diploptera punctata TaxID=6984 RepID=A0AAD7ZIV2_DIPPU|nr:hypothetical protein L9F63_023672 [Diploptera punctata]
MHPFERRFTKLRTKLILVGIWVAAIAISGVQLRIARTVRFKYAGEWHWDCGEQWESKSDGQSYTIVIFSATFAVPLLSLAFTYTCVGRRPLVTGVARKCRSNAGFGTAPSKKKDNKDASDNSSSICALLASTANLSPTVLLCTWVRLVPNRIREKTLCPVILCMSLVGKC